MAGGHRSRRGRSNKYKRLRRKSSGGLSFLPTAEKSLNPTRAFRAYPTVKELNTLLLFDRCDQGNALWRNLAAQELGYIRCAVNLLHRDPFLISQFGGYTFSNALRLAGLVKAKVAEASLDARMAQTVREVGLSTNGTNPFWGRNDGNVNGGLVNQMAFYNLNQTQNAQTNAWSG
jgi:hypothetical protein